MCENYYEFWILCGKGLTEKNKNGKHVTVAHRVFSIIIINLGGITVGVLDSDWFSLFSGKVFRTTKVVKTKLIGFAQDFKNIT